MATSNWSAFFNNSSNSSVSTEGSNTSSNNSYVYASAKNAAAQGKASDWSANFSTVKEMEASYASEKRVKGTSPSLITSSSTSVNSSADTGNNFKADPSDADYSTVSDVDLNSLLDGYTNPLLIGENVSWRCKIFAVSCEDFLAYQNDREASTLTQYILAETGLTSHYSIDEVVVNTLPSGSVYTKNGTITTIEVKLTEIGSLKLFDDLQLAVQALGYGSNFGDLPLFVEIGFVGYDSTTHLPYTLPETRLWACSIANSSCKVSSGGSQTVYGITLLRHIGSKVVNTKDESSSVAGQNIEFTAPSTFGEAVKELEKQCNKSLASIYPNWPKKFGNKVTSNTYITFNVDPEIAQYKILTDPQQDPSSDNNNKSPSAKKFTFKSSDTYANMINNILSSTQDPEDTKDKTRCTFADVIIENKYLGYDDDHNSGAYGIILHIVKISKYENQTVSDYRESTVQDLITELQKGHKKNSNLRIKRYDYLWSGLNTEILNFDYDFNTAAQVSITRNIIGQYDSHNRKGVKRSQYSPVDPILVGRETRAYGATTTQPQNKLSSDKTDSTVSTKLTPSTTTPTEGESLQSTIMTYLKSNAKTTKVLTFDDLDLAYDEGLIISPRYSSKNIRDITSGTDDANSHKAEIEKRMIRSNYYSSGTLLSITLGVVGDPHWLGPSDKNINAALEQAMNSQNTTATSSFANYDLEMLKNESCFLLNLYPAKYYNQNTGIATQDPDGVLAQCLYRVLSVTSTFNNSGFKQTLTAAGILKSLNK